MDSRSVSHDNLNASKPESPNDSRSDRSRSDSGSVVAGNASQTTHPNDSRANPLPPLEGNVTLRGKVTTETVVHSGQEQAPVTAPQATLGVSDDNSVLMRLFPPLSPAGSSINRSFDPAGIELAHFRIEERIGSGGMGAVFRALDTKLQRYVALKLLSPSQSYDSASVKRFQNEARAAARLDHENIARVYFIGEERGLHFIAFEFISGSTVRDLISKRGRLNAHDTVNYALQIAYALNHTSGMGVVHRDVKPSNIIITPKGRAKLVDLGLARKDGAESHGDLTLPGSTLGTFDYISPEQAKDPRSVDVRSDIYSLGCTMFHMLTGEVPYPDGTVLQKLLDHQNKDAPDVAKKYREISPVLSAIVRRMMNSDRAKRFQTPDQLVKELTKVAGAAGLRGVSPEGLVWVKSKSVQQKTWASHIGWVLTVACLLTVVVLLEYFPELSRNLTGVTGPPTDGQGEQISNANLVGDPRVGSGRIDQVPKLDNNGANGGRSATSTDVAANDDKGLMRNLLTNPHYSLLPDGGTQPNGQDTEGDTANKAASNDGGTKPPMPGDAASEIKAPPATNDADGNNTPNIGNTANLIADQARPFVVYAGDGTLKRRYLTLEAAVAELQDGNEIVLDFSGPRVEKPLRLSRSNVTIRAANEKTPVIEFTPTESNTHMISLQGGQVRLLNLQFSLNIPDNAAASHYSLFGMSQSSQLSLKRIVATITNPTGAARTSFIDSTIGFGDMPDMEMPGKSVNSLVVDISESILRGDGTLAHVGFEKKLDLTIEHSAIALSQDMFHFSTYTTSMLDRQLALQVNLNHVTAIVDGAVVKFAGPAKIENSSKVEWTARNCVFSPIAVTPFVLCDENIAAQDARRLLAVLASERNFYNQYEVFWSVIADGTAYSFLDWRSHWGSVLESRTKNERITFQTPIATLHNMIGSHFALRESTVDSPNAPSRGAVDGNDAGCDLTRLPIVFVSKEKAAADKSTAEIPVTSGAAASTDNPTEPDGPLEDD